MTQKSRAALLAQTASGITDNNNNEITALILRTLLIDIIDSALNISTDGTGTPTLAEVLAQGASSGANDIVMSDGRVVKLSSAGFTASLGTNTLTANRVINLPDAAGTLALLTDVIAAGVNFHHKRVISVLATPPGSPATGDRYLIASTGLSGAWVGHANELVEYSGTAWEYTTPLRGDVVYSHAQTDALYWYGVGTSTTSWQLISLKPAQYHHKVVTSILATPPGSPATGDRYLIADTGATGAWATHENKLAEWDGTAWVITAPTRGDVLYSLAQVDAVYWYGVGSATTSWQLITLKPISHHHKRVISVLATPPGSPATGDRYLIAATGASGAWSGHANELTEYNGAAWQFTVPVRGDVVYSHAQHDRAYWYGTGTSATAWQLLGLKHHRASVTGFLGTPPGSPSTGDRYIVSGGSGAWSGHEMEIAEWNGSAWVFELPAIGDTVFFTPGPEAFIVYIYSVIGGTPTWLQNNTLPTLLSVLTNGNSAPMHTEIEVRLVKEETVVTTHSSPGDVDLDMSSPHHRINASADINSIDWANIQDGVWYYIEIHAVGADVSITYKPNRWVYSDSLSAPDATITSGRGTFLVCRRYNGSIGQRMLIMAKSEHPQPI